MAWKIIVGRPKLSRRNYWNRYTKEQIENFIHNSTGKDVEGVGLFDSKQDARKYVKILVHNGGWHYCIREVL